jgi:hypothetical protein
VPKHCLMTSAPTDQGNMQEGVRTVASAAKSDKAQSLDTIQPDFSQALST